MVYLNPTTKAAVSKKRTLAQSQGREWPTTPKGAGPSQQEQLDAIAARLDQLEEDILALEDRIQELEDMEGMQAIFNLYA